MMQTLISRLIIAVYPSLISKYLAAFVGFCLAIKKTKFLSSILIETQKLYSCMGCQEDAFKKILWGKPPLTTPSISCPLVSSVQLLAALFVYQFPVNTAGRAGVMTQVFGPPPLPSVEGPDAVLGSWPQTQPQLLESESVCESSFTFSFSFPFIFITNKYVFV